MASTDRSFDARTIERFLRDGSVDKADYQTHLDNLPDVADKAEPLESEFEANVLDDSDDFDDADNTPDE